MRKDRREGEQYSREAPPPQAPDSPPANLPRAPREARSPCPVQYAPTPLQNLRERSSARQLAARQARPAGRPTEKPQHHKHTDPDRDPDPSRYDDSPPHALHEPFALTHLLATTHPTPLPRLTRRNPSTASSADSLTTTPSHARPCTAGPHDICPRRILPTNIPALAAAQKEGREG